MEKEILITKASGDREFFSEVKLRRSLEMAKVPPDIADAAVSHVYGKLAEGVSTSDIDALVFTFLRKKRRAIAARYHLKKALMELGPSGFPFEKLVGEIFKARGYSVAIGKIAQGLCVSHELDVVAQKGDEHIMVECKYHNQPGTKSDVKTALYVQARFEDIQKRREAEPERGQKFNAVWLATNTKLTVDAIDYATCAGMHAVGWSYPAEGNLQQLIETANLHPLTCLTSLSREQKLRLLDRGLVLCSDIVADKSAFELIRLNSVKIARVMEEIDELCRAK